MKIQTFNVLIGSTNCNAQCPFCISKMTPTNGMDVKQPKINWKNFEKACQLARINNVCTVLMTGKGEPLLYPEEVTEFLLKLKRYDFPIVELQTNAILLGNNFEKYKRKLKLWKKKGLNTFVISIVHYEDKKNKEIYVPKGNYFELEKLIKNLHSLGFSIRLNCILLRGYIDSVKRVKDLLNFCKKNNVEQLTLKPVETLKNLPNKKIAEQTKKLLLFKRNEEEIHHFLEMKATKLRTLDFGGVVYDYDGQNVCMTDCLNGKPLSEDLRQLIFFPDGHLRYDWRYEGAILI